MAVAIPPLPGDPEPMTAEGVPPQTIDIPPLPDAIPDPEPVVQPPLPTPESAPMLLPPLAMPTLPPVQPVAPAQSVDPVADQFVREQQAGPLVEPGPPAAPRTTLAPLSLLGPVGKLAQWFVDQKTTDTDVRANINLMTAEPEAVKVAKAAVLARRVGLPEDLVFRNLPEIEKEQKFDDYTAILPFAPKLKDWVASNPANASLAQAGNGSEQLPAIERSYNAIFVPRGGGDLPMMQQVLQRNSDYLRSLASGALSGMAVSTLNGLADLSGRLGFLEKIQRSTISTLGLKGIEPYTPAQAEHDYRLAAQQLEAWTRAHVAVPPERQTPATRFVEGVGSLGANVLVSSFDPFVGGASFLAQSHSDATREVKAMGLEGTPQGEAVIWAQTAFSAAMSVYGVSAILGEVPGKIADPVMRIAGDLGYTFLKSGTQAALSRSFRNTLHRYALNQPVDILQGTGSAFWRGGAMGTLLRGARWATGDIETPPPQMVRVAPGPATPEEAKQLVADLHAASDEDVQAKIESAQTEVERAEQNATQLDDVIAKVTDSDLYKTSPEKAQELVEQFAQPGQAVYVDAPALATALQEMPEAEANAKIAALGITPEALQHAQDTGVEIAVPPATYIANVGDLHADLRDDVHVGNERSVNQANEWIEQKTAALENAGEVFKQGLADQVAKGQINDPWKTVYDDMRQRFLKVGFTPAMAKMTAAFGATGYARRAADLPEIYADAADAWAKREYGGADIKFVRTLPERISGMEPEQFNDLIDKVRVGYDATDVTAMARANQREMAAALSSLALDPQKLTNDEIREELQKAADAGEISGQGYVVAMPKTIRPDRTGWGSVSMGGHAIEVATNPTQDDIRAMAKEANHHTVRMLAGPDGNIYAWDAWYATHDDMARVLKIPINPDMPTFATALADGKLTQSPEFGPNANTDWYREQYAQGLVEDRLLRNVTWEAIPSTTLDPDLARADEATKRLWTQRAMSITVDADSGKDLLAEKIGVTVRRVEMSKGTFGPNISPNVITAIDGPPEKVDQYARAIQYIYGQDGVPWFRADPNVAVTPSGPYAAGVYYTLDEPLTPETERDFLSSVHEHLGPQYGYTLLSPTTAVIVNFRGADGQPMGLPDEEFGHSADAIGQAIGAQNVERFGSEGNYHAHDWAADNEGLVVLADAAQGSPALQTWLSSRHDDFQGLLSAYRTTGLAALAAPGSQAALSGVPVSSYAQQGIDSFRQPDNRGELILGRQQIIMRFGEHADVSTALHEFMHLWTKEFEYDATLVPGRADIQERLQQMRDIAGAEPDGTISREGYEKLAKGFETYLFEGKAPTPEMRDMFREARAGMIDVYKDASRIGAPITPEMRDFFDHMLATDDQIEAAKTQQGLNPVFTSAEAMGVNAKQYQQWTDRVQAAQDADEQRLLDKTMVNMRRERSKVVNEATDRIEPQVIDELNQEPGRKALYFLRNGEMPEGGTPETWKGLKLYRPEVEALIGADGVASLPHGITSAERGLDPEALAKATGYANGYDLLNGLIQAQGDQAAMRANGDNRSLFDVAVAEETARRVKAEIGDPLATIQEDAMDAVHNTKRADVMIDELRALAVKSGQIGGFSRADVEDWAAKEIDRMPVWEATQTGRYERAERSAGNRVQKALLNGDDEEAFKAKQDQVLAFHMYREAKDAADFSDKFIKTAQRLAGDQPNIEAGTREQINDILDKFDISKRKFPVEQREKWAAWADRQKQAGYDAIPPPEGQRPWSTLSMEELRGLHGSLQQMEKIGRWYNTVQVGDEKMAFLDLKSDLIDKGNEQPQYGEPLDVRQRRGLTQFENSQATWRYNVNQIDSELMKVEYYTRWMDGGDPNGPWTRSIYRPMAAAQRVRDDAIAERHAELSEVINGVPAEQRAKWSDVVETPLLGGDTKFNRFQIIKMALNLGNQSNIDKMTQGEGWNHDDVLKTVNGTLTSEEWDYVEGVWGIFEKQWPRVVALQEAVDGVVPPHIEPVPVETPYGTKSGGYFPMQYDRATIKGQRIVERQMENLFSQTYQRANTRAGATFARVEGYSGAVDLSLSGIGEALRDMEHDLAFRQPVMEVGKLLRDPDIRASIINTLGSEAEGQFYPWLKSVANDQKSVTQVKGVEGWLRAGRSNMAIVNMLRVPTLLNQPGRMYSAANQIGVGWLGKGYASFLSNPQGASDLMDEYSDEMPHRRDHLDRDLQVAAERAQTKSEVMGDLHNLSLRTYALIDASISKPLWMGAYAKATASEEQGGLGMTNEDAGFYADQQVRFALGAGGVKDTSAIQRGSEFQRAVTGFYNYANVRYNQNRDVAHQLRAEGYDFSSMLDAANSTFWLVIAPALTAAALNGHLPNNPEKPGDWLSWAGSNIAAQALVGVPIVSEIGGPFIRARVQGKEPPPPRLNGIAGPVTAALETAYDAYRVASGLPPTRYFLRNAWNTAGTFTGLPVGQVGIASQFAWDALVSGKESPQDALEWARGFAFGHARAAQ